MKQINFLKNVAFGVLVLITTFSVASFAQLSGTYTVGGSSPDYSTLSAAISALNSQGVNGPVIFNIRDGNYSGSSWRGSIGNVTGASSTNTITFQSQSGNKANCVLSPTGSSSSNYVFYLNNAKYVTIKNLTLNNTSSSYGCDIRIAGAASNCNIENCVLTGHTGNSTSTNKSRVYGTSIASSSDFTFDGCTFERGSVAMYLTGNSTTSLVDDYVFKNCTFNNQYYRWAYVYYGGGFLFENNTFNRSGSASSYFYGLYLYRNGNNTTVKNNTFNNTCQAYYNYCTYFYYSNYYTNNKTNTPLVEGNTYNMNTGSRTRYSRPSYDYRTRYGHYKNNTYNINSTYSSCYMYMMYAFYYGENCMVEDNTINMNNPNGGYGYGGMYYGNNDTFRNNTINMTGNMYSYPYFYYIRNHYIVNNTINVKTNSRTAYGAYIYRYPGVFAYNKINVESNTGTIYGMYPYYAESKIHSNSVWTKTSRTNYTCRMYRTYKACEIYNNTFYSAATGSTNYTMYAYQTSSSYGGKIYNNIFARSGTNGRLFYVYRSNYVEADHNLFSAPGGSYFQRASPGYSTNSLANWRLQTKLDKNSLKYLAPFNDAANKDLSIDADAPGAWAVNGRSLHDTTISMDIDGNPRPTTVQAGVPDIGAYEVTPTSTPPNADAVPANPVANSTQVFTFGDDTVATIDWGATVPSTYTMRQYTGTQAGPMPAGVGRMFFYTAATPNAWVYPHTPHVYYKDNWIGDVPSESDVVIARSSNGGAWEGYNYTNAATNTTLNMLAPTNSFDSVGAYTGVQNGRIGIRCVENPKNVVISGITAFDATVDWDPVFNPIGYQIVRKKVNTPPTETEWSNAGIVPSNTHAYSALDEDTKYYIFVRSICGPRDTSGYTLDSFATIITCHEPDITISAVNHERAVVSWDDIKTAEKYEYVLNEDPNAPTFGMDMTKTSVLAPYLDPNKQYYVHIRTHCNTMYSNSQWETKPFKTWALGVGNIANEHNGVSIYPNPATTELQVTVSEGVKGNGMVQVLDMTGKVLQSQVASGNVIKVQLSNLPSGVYMLQYTDDNHREQIKFNKQ